MPPECRHFDHQHQQCAREALSLLIAELIGGDFLGEVPAGVGMRSAPYFLPAETLTFAKALDLGITSEEDFFGGVVPNSLFASKAISHTLVSESAVAPAEWNGRFSEAVRKVVLPGFTVFARKDALTAGAELLQGGPIRVKATSGFAGFGQATIRSESELRKALEHEHWEKISLEGLVLERCLENVSACSVGQIRAGGVIATYYGSQKEVRFGGRDNVYVGSALLVARGGFDALLSLDFPDEIKKVIIQARTFDEAAELEVPFFFASRRNYDVIRGFEPSGKAISAVLEQSWRVGGASAAELLALRAFKSDPTLERVKARTIEIFGDLAEIPDDAFLLYRGVDPDAGPLTRFAVWDRT